MEQSSFDWGSLAGGVLQTVSNIWGNNSQSSAPVVIRTVSNNGSTSGGGGMLANPMFLVFGVVILALFMRK